MNAIKMIPTTDSALLEAWQAGDSAAGDELLSRHYPTLRRFFGRRLEREHEALIQATCLACIERMLQFRSDAGFRALLQTTAWRMLCRYIRDRRSEAALESSPPRPPASTSLAAKLALAQECELLERALDSLAAMTPRLRPSTARASR